MDAWFLRALFDSVYVLAVAVWVGSTFLFTFGVAPMAVSEFGADVQRRLVRVLYPRFYLWGTVCGAVALPAAMGVPLSFPEYRAPGVAVKALAILAGTLLMLYGGNSLAPALNAARDDGEGGRERFARLYRRSVALNGVVLAIGVVLLIAFANRPAPRSSGILEPSPQERAQREADAWRARFEQDRPAATEGAGR